MGNWEEAVNVLALMKSEGVEPVLRTFKCVPVCVCAWVGGGPAGRSAGRTSREAHKWHPTTLLCSCPPFLPPTPHLRSTLIIACNMCNQPREAMAVYRRMLEEGYSPNSVRRRSLMGRQLGSTAVSCMLACRSALARSWLWPFVLCCAVLSVLAGPHCPLPADDVQRAHFGVRQGGPAGQGHGGVPGAGGGWLAGLAGLVGRGARPPERQHHLPSPPPCRHHHAACSSHRFVPPTHPRCLTRRR